MIGKLITSSSLVALAAGAKCTRETWATMLDAAAEVDTQSGDSYFLNSPSLDHAMSVIDSHITGALGQDATALPCYEPMAAKYTAVYEIANGGVAVCVDSATEECKAYAVNVDAEFDYGTELYVVGRTEYKVDREVGWAVDGVDKYDLAAKWDDVYAFKVGLRDAVDARLGADWVSADVTTVAETLAWSCHENREAAKYPIYAKKRVACTGDNVPVGCVDTVAVKADYAACAYENVAVAKLETTAEDRWGFEEAVAGIDVGKYLNSSVSLAAGLVAVGNALTKSADLAQPLRLYDFYACYEQYWVDLYPVLSDAKKPCTAVNTPAGCVDVAALATARDACLAVAPVEVEKFCSYDDQLAVVAALEAHNFTATEFSDAHDNAYAMIYSFLLSAQANGTLSEAAMNETCINCAVTGAANLYTIDGWTLHAKIPNRRCRARLVLLPRPRSSKSPSRAPPLSSRAQVPRSPSSWRSLSLSSLSLINHLIPIKTLLDEV